MTFSNHFLLVILPKILMCNFQHASTPITEQESCIFFTRFMTALIFKSIQRIHSMPLTISYDTIFTVHLTLDLLYNKI